MSLSEDFNKAVAATLTYYIDTKNWDAQYVDQLRHQFLYDQ